ncbi:hypothetical protein HDU93_003085, partial [Gonapodya sp. JEL0774]
MWATVPVGVVTMVGTEVRAVDVLGAVRERMWWVTGVGRAKEVDVDVERVGEGAGKEKAPGLDGEMGDTADSEVARRGGWRRGSEEIGEVT